MLFLKLENREAEGRGGVGERVCRMASFAPGLPW